MGEALTKELLVEAFYKISGNHETAKIHALINNIDNFASSLDFDTDLKNMRTVLHVWLSDFNNDSYETTQEFAQPIFDYLDKNPEWSFFDITILYCVVAHTKILKTAHELTQKALAIMDDKYDHEDLYWTSRWTIQYNILPRIVRARYYPDVKGEPKEDLETLKEMFEQYLAYVYKACDDYDLYMAKLITSMRQSAFEGNYAKVESALQKLKTYLNDKGPVAIRIFTTTLQEVMNYHRYLGSTLSEKQLRFIVGLNIRKRRLAIKMSRADLAAILKTGADYIGGIEQGHKNPSMLHLYRIADALGVDMNYLYYGEHSFTEGFDLKPIDEKLAEFLSTLTIKEKQKFLSLGMVMQDM